MLSHKVHTAYFFLFSSPPPALNNPTSVLYWITKKEEKGDLCDIREEKREKNLKIPASLLFRLHRCVRRLLAQLRKCQHKVFLNSLFLWWSLHDTLLWKYSPEPGLIPFILLLLRRQIKADIPTTITRNSVRAQIILNFLQSICAGKTIPLIRTVVAALPSPGE